MFTIGERERVRERLLSLAREDAGVVGAAITGSHALGGGDEWSDIDLAFAIRGELAPALSRWTESLDTEFGALQHWDLPFGSSIYRVWLLPGWLEVDIAFTPEADFGARGPTWRTVFGETVEVPETPPLPQEELIGLGWHAALHARICIERGQPWQAEWYIARVRENTIALACLRLGHPTRFAKGADLLPPELTDPLEAALVRSLSEAELRRALAAGADAFANELELVEGAIGVLLRPMLEELTVRGPADAGPRTG
jgi:hypothetical protein